MDKLKMKIEELAVETFEIGLETDSHRGTVRANEAPTIKTICGSLLASNPTCCPCTP